MNRRSFQRFIMAGRLHTMWLAVCILLPVSVFAQTQQIASVYHDVHLIESKTLNEQRSIWVRVPLNYQQTTEKFPVVYMLDGHAPQPSMMAGIIEQQAWGGQMPEMILVSIQNTNRSRDMTPTDDGKGGTVGGGGRFLEFIEKEVIPLVEKNYRTRPLRIFAGHSLGGMTVVYSFVTRPDLFNAYIAASPVLDYDDDFVIKEAAKLFRQKREFENTMYLGIGDEPQYIGGFNRFRKLLESEKPKKLDFEFREFKEDNHASVVLPVYYAGLRKIFDGWAPKNINTVADLESHYKKLSKRFGYEILIPEDTLNTAAYQILGQKNYAEAIRLFRKNAENYPNSANVFDSLGEGYEANGQNKEAKDSYEKAYKMAKEQGNEALASAIKTHLDRVLKKL
ncbi:MAG: alpha/beta hydrolase-fold protein [Pyrinomonadaceae bacterium]